MNLHNFNFPQYSEYFIMAVMFVILFAVSIVDLKRNIIPNKVIKKGFVIGFLFLFALGLITAVGRFTGIIGQYYQPSYFLFIFYNTALAFVFSFILWDLKLWAGGDAKLFTLLVFLLPLAFYTNAYFKYWPALNLMINICIPIFVYLLLKMLFYPLKVLSSYLKSPELLKEYYKNFKNKRQLPKDKIKTYINTALSFLVILIFFQLLRLKVTELLGPYLGSLVTASYLCLGLVIFKPLKAFLQNKLLFAGAVIVLYFVLGLIYFKGVIFSELHSLFALQMIFMASYFYIFKYGKQWGSFLYNSTEVKMIPIDDLQAGLYINKTYIKDLMGNRVSYDQFKEEVGILLEEKEKDDLWKLIGKKTDKKIRSQEQYEWLSLLRYLRLDYLPTIIQQVYGYKKEKDQEKKLLSVVKEKLNGRQRQTLDSIIHGTDDVSQFLKTIRGKLTPEQAEKLKAMIIARNEEIAAQGFDPVKHVVLHKTFSFAPFMLLGVIISVATKSDLIHLVYQYILHR